MKDIELEEMHNGRLVKYSSFEEDQQSKIKYMKSRKQYDKLLEFTGSLPKIKDRFLLKANALLSLKRWNEAIEWCDRGLEIEEDSEFYNMKGRAYGGLRNME